MNIIKELFTSVFKIQDIFFKHSLESSKQMVKRKHHLGSGCYVTIDSVAEAEKEKMEFELSNLLKSHNYDVAELLKYLKSQGFEVYTLKNIKLLNLIGECAGFIYPQRGIKALGLSFIVAKELSLKTEAMFVVPEGILDKYYFIYHFYNWFAYKRGISGMDSNSINLLNKYLYNASDDDIKKLSLKEIYKLKDAIKQDKASIDFLLKICKENEGIRKAFSKISDNGAQL